MEELLKLVTAEQSKRSAVFMFSWKVIMAVLMTNYYMNQMGYFFINKEIKFNMIIDFILSDKFFFAASLYLLWIGIFFWGIKVFMGVLRLVFVRKHVNWSEAELLKILHYAFVKDSNGNIYFKNRDEFQSIQILCEAIADGGGTGMERLYSLTNVIISTAFWVHTFKNLDIPSYLDLILIVMSSIAIGLLVFFEYLFCVGGELQSVMLKYKGRGFYSDIIQEMKG